MEEYKGYTMAEGSMEDYEGMFGFGPLLRGRTFNHILATYRKTQPGKSVLAAEIAGYGFVFDGMEIDLGLAVAMGRHPKRPDTQMVIGDMLEQSTWNDVNRWLKGRKFALALCRPLKPFVKFIDPIVFSDFIDNVVDTLNHGGVLYTQVPLCLMSFARALAECIRMTPGVEVNLPEGDLIEAMEIIKS